MSVECTFCHSDVHRHEPIFVDELQHGEREQAGKFCNWACLRAYIDGQNLIVGTSCEIDC